MRSAETLYSLASVCRVALLSSFSQRAWTMARLRGSSACRPFASLRCIRFSCSACSVCSAGSMLSSASHCEGLKWSLSSSSSFSSKAMSCPWMRLSISKTSLVLTLSSSAMTLASASFSQLRLFFMLRRLKKSLRCALVVAILTMRQLRMMYSWISLLIQWTAKETRRTPRCGSKRLTAFIRPTLPSWMRSPSGRP